MSSVKTKIRTGTLFLFALLLLTGGIGIYYLVQLKKDAQQILYNNYESLEYAHVMQQSLNNLNIDSVVALENLTNALSKQEKNVTEPGEKEATTALRQAFDKWRNGDTSIKTRNDINQAIQQILFVNMKAIQHKNKIAEQTAANALTYISLIAALIFLIAVSFAYNFPSIITNPVKQLKLGLEEIAAGNYSYRIHIANTDEFGNMATSFNSMAEKLAYYANSNLNKLIFEKTRAEAVINSLKDASIGIDKSNTILFANKQALQLLGMQAEEIVGKSSEAIQEKNDLFKFLQNDKNVSLVKIVIDNKENYFNKETIDLTDDGQGSKVIVLKNITSFKELDVAKTNFIATISHELKTPLASSDFGIKLLEDERTGSLSSDQKNIIQHLKEDNKRMLKILSELLNISQVESGKMQLNLQTTDAKHIVDIALETVDRAANEKNILIKNDLSENLPLVKTDIEKTAWVLNNFLTNAIKNAPGDSEILLRVEAQEKQIIFCVKDSGIGIPEEHLHRVFERYYKVPGSNNAGTGLGLAIAKEFIEAMGGRIWATSSIGNGSEFCFSLPA